jgi:chromosome segregation ATPase
MPEEHIDIRKIIKDGTSVTTIQDLAKKGYTRIRVINEQMITKLISEAVERIVSTKTNLLTEQERERIIQESRRELERLVREHQLMKEKAESIEKDKSAMIKEIENLTQQLKLMQKLSEQEAMRKFDEGVALQQKKINALEDEIQNLRIQLEAKETEIKKEKEQLELLKHQTSELKSIMESDQSEHREIIKNQQEQIRKMESAVNELQKQLKKKENQLIEVQNKIADLKIQRETEKKEYEQIIQNYQYQVKEYERKIAELKEEQEASKQQIQELLRLNVALQLGVEERFKTIIQEQEAMKQQVEEVSEKDYTKDFEKVLGRFSESLAKKLRSMAVLKPGEEELFKPGDVTIKSILEAIASGQVSTVKEERLDSKKVAKAVDKLKALRSQIQKEGDILMEEK